MKESRMDYSTLHDLSRSYRNDTSNENCALLGCHVNCCDRFHFQVETALHSFCRNRQLFRSLQVLRSWAHGSIIGTLDCWLPCGVRPFVGEVGEGNGHCLEVLRSRDCKVCLVRSFHKEGRTRIRVARG